MAFRETYHPGRAASSVCEVEGYARGALLQRNCQELVGANDMPAAELDDVVGLIHSVANKGVGEVVHLSLPLSETTQSEANSRN